METIEQLRRRLAELVEEILEGEETIREALESIEAELEDLDEKIEWLEHKQEEISDPESFKKYLMVFIRASEELVDEVEKEEQVREMVEQLEEKKLAYRKLMEKAGSFEGLPQNPGKNVKELLKTVSSDKKIERKEERYTVRQLAALVEIGGKLEEKAAGNTQIDTRPLEQTLEDLSRLGKDMESQSW